MISPSVCVFCGARSGNDTAYQQAAQSVGTALAHNNWRLVYGAGDVGLMGTVARAAQEAGGDTFGVIPTHLLKAEVGKTDLSRFVITENMHERKKVMFMNCDAIVVLPGGAGSLDEFFEVLTWRQLQLHQKPIFLLNTNGFWDPLLTLVQHVIDQGFADASLREMIRAVADTDELVAGLTSALPKVG